MTGRQFAEEAVKGRALSTRSHAQGTQRRRFMRNTDQQHGGPADYESSMETWGFLFWRSHRTTFGTESYKSFGAFLCYLANN
jgi:hypothetical protein